MGLKNTAKQSRLSRYKSHIQQKLSSHIIDCEKPEFSHLKNDRGKKMSPLNGDILLGLDYGDDLTLHGVISITQGNLALQLPEIKEERRNGTDVKGFKKHLDKWEAEGIDLLSDVDDPIPDEFVLSATEELLELNILAMSDYEAKQKLIELRQRLLEEV